LVLVCRSCFLACRLHRPFCSRAVPWCCFEKGEGQCGGNEECSTKRIFKPGKDKKPTLQ
jgi:hypothetical protein